MRTISLLAVTVVAASAPLRTETQARADLVISHVRVIDGEGSPPADRHVVVRDGVITSTIDAGREVPDAAATIDGSGKYLIPALWDMHVHLAARPEPELAERVMLPLFLAHGIVGVRDMGGPPDRVLALRDRVRGGSLKGPRILTPGPFVDGAGDPDSMFRRVTSPGDAEQAVRDLEALRVDFVKVQANLSREVYPAVVNAARSRGLIVSGHVPIALSVSDVVPAGQRSVEHLSPALVGDAGLLFACSRREAELRKQLLAIEEGRPRLKPEEIRSREAALRAELVTSYDPERARAVGRLLTKHGTWIVPTMIWANSLRPLGPSDRAADVPLEFVPSATRKRWQDAREKYLKAAPPAAFEAASAVARTAAAAVGTLHAAGVRILAGTDTFDGFVLPGFSLHQELALFVDAGLSPLEALKTATRNAAEYRGKLGEEGTIAPGKRADLVLLDADPLRDIGNTRRIASVVTGGLVLSRSDLDALLASARDAAR